jgi:hypothetical protein
MTETIQTTDEDVIIKRYKVRLTGRFGSSIETTVPKEVFEREARRLGLTVREALEKLVAVWRFDSFKGLRLTFEPKKTKV